MKQLKIILDDGAIMPSRAHEDDSGLDIMTPIDFTVPAHGSAFIDSGLHVQLPKNTTGFLKSKSGLNARYGITTDGGVIDVGYNGSIRIKVYNHSDTDYKFMRGDKVTQLVIIPVFIPKKLVKVTEFPKTKRGFGGFGSTGR